MQVSEFDALLTEKDEVVEQLEHLRARSHTPPVLLSPEHETSREVGVITSSRSYSRRGKAHQLRYLQERIPRIVWKTGSPCCRGLQGGIAGRQTRS